MMDRRKSGILLHITSLPSPYGIGDFGPWAYKFADFLTEARQSLWQVLPLNPTSLVQGNSPYSSYSAFAGNLLLISPDLLVDDGLLSKSELEGPPPFPKESVDYRAAFEYKERVLRRAYETWKGKPEKDYAFERFCRENSDWLEDYSLFVALKEHFQGAVWSDWPRELRDRKEEAIQPWKERLGDRVSVEKFVQYLFFKQWSSLKTYCNRKGVQIVGDIPIYVTYDSSDVWANPGLFKLNEEKKPTSVAGVPPDYFSATGQLWGNPVYGWETLKETRYAWWIRRMEHNLRLFNIVRVDHFRGLVAYWEVPAGEKTAIHGRWTEVPVRDFFGTLFKYFPCLPVIAEDLGVITPDVREALRDFGFPGMKVLLFAFGGDDLGTHPYIPHNYTNNSVVYTGTHDNNTIKGWFRREARPEDKKRFFEYVGREVGEEEVHWEFIRLAMRSVGNTVIMPMQDVLGLGEEARMNTPATPEGNWKWRLLPEQLTPSVIHKLSEMTHLYGRG